MPALTHWIDGSDHLDSADAALIALLGQLKQRDYHFITPTPATHARITARASHRTARNLREVLGWNLPFNPGVLDRELLQALRDADALAAIGEGQFKARYRVSSMGDQLLLHSAYPTGDRDAVFFGPDSYRFANFVRAELDSFPPSNGAWLVDMGAGSGVGAIVAAKLYPALRITMTDINAQALRLARINALAAGVEAKYVHCANLDGVEVPFDIAIANPPYIIDPAQRHYRDGGDMYGAGVSYEMAASALERLSRGGRFILYTGSAIVEGRDLLRAVLFDMVAQRGCTIRYAELDPDVFGEELDQPAYCDVERIAIVGAVISRPA